MKKKVLLHYVLGIAFFLAGLTHAQTKDKFALQKTDSWLIIDGNICDINKDWLKYKHIGYILNLHYNEATKSFYHQPEHGDSVDFTKFTNHLIENIKKSNKRYAIIFNLDKNDIEHFNIEVSNIEKHLASKTKSTSKNTLHDLFNAGNDLFYFSLLKNEKFKAPIHSFYDYFETHHINDAVYKQIFNPTRAQASMLYGIYENPKTNTTESSIELITDERHSWQNKYLNDWNKTGLQPVFIVSDCQPTNNYPFSEIANTSGYTHSCNGIVTINDVPMDYVYWLGNDLMFSYGYFNMPLSESKILKPYRAGYTFEPGQIEVKQGSENTFSHFKASPLNIQDNLRLSLRFNDSIDLPKISPECEIINDKTRGNVLKVNKNGIVQLGTTTEYQIKDNSFSVSFWFKTSDTLQGKHAVFGTNTTNFREGLHIQIRNASPYFGFFIDDVRSKTKIDYLNWHHLAFSYDKASKEKRIYIDGVLTDIASNSPSFIGNDSLYIGQCIGDLSERPFYIDNFNLWNRALNENEIKRLQTEDVLLMENTKSDKNYVWILLSSLLIIAFTFWYFSKKEKTNHTHIIHRKNNKNSIQLFGDFSIFDNQGNEIASKMPRLSKELFLKLLSAKIRGKQGVTSENLTLSFWKDLSTKKARNSRNVALARLRKYISPVEGIHIEYIDGKHCVTTDETLFIDYLNSQHYTKVLDSKNFIDFMQLVGRGAFLKDANYDWIETLQDDVNRDTINTLSNALQNAKFNLQDDLIEGVCKHILELDDLNEEALKTLLALYKKQEKTSLMDKAFYDFTTTYRKVYGTDFELTIAELLNNID